MTQDADLGVRVDEQASALKVVARGVEFSVLFVAGPLILYDKALDWVSRGANILLVLALVTGFCLTLLLTDKTFDRRLLWNREGFWRHWKLTAALLPVVVVAVGLLAYLSPSLVPPERRFYLVRTMPHIWVLIVLLYPILSVLPQTIVWRTFIFHRYAAVFPGASIIVASGLSFGWMHILFQNWLAPVLTVVGGLLFAWTYWRSRSTALSVLEHALIGLWTFSVGFGWYFYAGAAR